MKTMFVSGNQKPYLYQCTCLAGNQRPYFYLDNPK